MAADVTAYRERSVALTEPVTAALRRISWGAVFAGVAVSLVTQLLIALLGIGIGLVSVDPLGDTPDPTTLGIGAAAWWALSGILAAFVGGWVAARLAGLPDRMAGTLHGLVTFAVSIIFVFYLLTSAVGAVVGGTYRIVGDALSGIGNVASEAASGIADAAEGPLQKIQQEASASIGQNDVDKARKALSTALSRLLTSSDDEVGESRQAVVEILVQQGAAPAEAEAQITRWEDAYRTAVAETERQAREAADKTADAIATASFYAFVTLVLGAIAGFLGGRIGTPTSTPVLAESDPMRRNHDTKATDSRRAP